LIITQVYTNPQGQLNLAWQVNASLLAQEERSDGRYLLVTNNWRLSHAELFQLYREKDGGEKRFLISKSDLHVSPVFLHKDERIAAYCCSICSPCWLTASWNANSASKACSSPPANSSNACKT
jgi:transposase